MSERIEYRDIAGWPGYRVGSDGSVWTKRTNRRYKYHTEYQLLTPRQQSGHSSVLLTRDDPESHSHKQVSHLVLNAFLGPPPARFRPIWLNGDRSDNRAENLVWKAMPKSCTECGGEVVAKGLCSTHYDKARWRSAKASHPPPQSVG